MFRILIKLAAAGVITCLAIALSPLSARSQTCFVSQQVLAAGPTLVPASERRNIIVEDWRIAFSVPETYQLSRQGLRMNVSPPIAPQASAQSAAQVTQCDATAHGVSISIVNRVVSESGIRNRLAPGEGTFLGLTDIPSGTAFMHTTRTRGNRVHLSIPFPNQPVSVVFTAHADSNGEIFHEGVFETILETFRFRDQ